MNPFKNVSPRTRAIMKETARVCVCVGALAFAQKLILGGARRLCGV